MKNPLLLILLVLVATWALPCLAQDVPQLAPIAQVSSDIGGFGGLTWPVAVFLVARELRAALDSATKELHAAATELAHAVRDWQPSTLKIRLERQDLAEWDRTTERRRSITPKASLPPES